ncbi:MAG: aldo/keto reductase [Clostridiales Family XIII bacterium]|nr:aldo/keto reductase [Clostridiales Family XIII bacterium]
MLQFASNVIPIATASIAQTSPHSRITKHRKSSKHCQALPSITSLANAYNISLLQLAMKWCLGRQGVTTVITGSSKLSQLEQNIRSVDGDALNTEILTACDEVWYDLAGRSFAYNR